MRRVAQRQVMLDDETVKAAKEIGVGNLSRGLRRAVRKYIEITINKEEAGVELRNQAQVFLDDESDDIPFD